MKKVPIRYTGLVETGYRDHMFGSGAVWPFPDAVVDVPVAHAIKYLEYSEFEDARDDKSVPLRDLLRELKLLAGVERRRRQAAVLDGGAFRQHDDAGRAH